MHAGTKSGRFGSRSRLLLAAGLAVTAALLCRCKSPGDWRSEADEVSYGIIESHREAALGRSEPFTIEPPQDTLRRRLLQGQDLPFSAPGSLSSKDVAPIPQWPDNEYLQPGDDPAQAPPWSGEEPVSLTLMEALEVGARNNREYQTQKELVFQAALALDLERAEFRSQWAGLISGTVSSDLSEGDPVSGVSASGSIDLFQRFTNGVTFLGRLGVDLAQLLSGDQASSLGLFGDATVAIPLMRGSGTFVVTEPLTQADRNVVYAIYNFERFKRVFAVDVAAQYLTVLQRMNVLHNAEDNYEWLVGETRRARRMAATGRLPEFQVDQARQDELSARDTWIAAQLDYQRELDRFKDFLNLPTDAAVALDPAELERLTRAAEAWPRTVEGEEEEPGRADSPVRLVPPSNEGAGPLELDERRAIEMAIENRLDLRVAIGQVFDSQRQVAVSADLLRADLTLFGAASVGDRRTAASDAGLPDAEFRFDEGQYSALATLDLPLYRVPERNIYRGSLIAFEQQVRNLQAVEDRIKFEIRDDLRVLLESRERLRIEFQSVELARRRVESTVLLLRAQRADVRDVLEAQEDLLDSLNSLSFEVVRYRIAELALQRDLDVLEVDERGLWREYGAVED